MFVTLPGNAIIIVTLTSDLLVEKDITGKVKQTLDLSSLTALKVRSASEVNQTTGSKKNRWGRVIEADDSQGEYFLI